MSYGYRYPVDSGGMSMSSIITFVHPYWAGLKRYWWVPVLLGALGAGGMLLAVRNAPPPDFVSTARIWVGIRSADPTGMGRAMNDAEGTQLEIMNSPQIRTRTENRVQAENPNLSVTPVTLAAAPVRGSTFQLTARGANAPYVEATLGTFIKEYEAYLKETAIKTLDQNNEAINLTIEQLQRDLLEKQDRLTKFRAENSFELLKARAVSSAAAFGTYRTEFESYRQELHLLETMSLEQAMDHERRMSITTAASSAGTEFAERFADSPEAQARLSQSDALNNIYNTRLSLEMMRYELDELSVGLKPKHPKIVNLVEAIARSERSLESLVAQSREKIEQRKKALVILMESLERPMKEKEEESQRDDALLAEYNALLEDISTTKPTIDRLEMGKREMALRQSLSDHTVNVLAPPSPAVANPLDKITKLVMGTAAGLVLGVGLVALIVFFDDRVKSLTALKAAFQEPIIGQVPNVGNSSDSNTKIDLIKQDDDRHNFTESFRNIRSSILFLEAGENRPKTIVITSAIPSEGKSSVAANLAKTMAMSGSKVLLVDGDQRRCSINEKFGLPVEPGFSDVLTGKMKLEDAMLNPEPNLFILVRGTQIKHPGELFIGSEADNFLKSVYDQFDFILIDTPPVLAADDVTSLAPKVDGVLFVIRADHTSSRLAKQSLEQLYNRHVRVLGLIYNRANLFLPEYSYYKYASYYQKSETTPAS